ncbi:MAG TPA: DnaB-like helicase C-terminal domain-containing protein [Polyangiaceae bacterium]|nr:DnaB-like helicase C-terminal domain-containing protein [Polyangiaceae bacterium]
MGSRRPKKAPDLPRSLADVHVDVRSRLGAVSPTTTTGIGALDKLLGGGLRSGTHLLVSGGPGTGKTSFALMLAYMAARARASVLFTSVGLDETEILARLTSRALHREYQNVAATYGTIWSGVSTEDEGLRGPIGACLDTVTKKVGDYLHLHTAEPLHDVASVADQASLLWARNERVVVVVDGLEGYGAGAALSASFDARLFMVACELSRLASQGCAVVSTCSLLAAPYVVPVTTIAAELKAPGEASPKTSPRKKGQHGARPMDLAIQKNRHGPTPTIPLVYLAVASVFEERNQ